MTRTPDPRITNALLYQLSYTGTTQLFYRHFIFNASIFFLANKKIKAGKIDFLSFLSNNLYKRAETEGEKKMALDSFFKKPFTVHPSGKTPHERGVKVSKYGKRLAAVTTAAAAIVLMGSCGKTYSEIDAIKDKVPAKEQRDIKQSYDEALLWKIDSLHWDAGQDMQSAISQGVREMNANLPADTAQWTPQDYVLSDHAQQRYNEALPTSIKIGTLKMNRINKHFRDDLRDDIAKVNKQKDKEFAQAAQAQAFTR